MKRGARSRASKGRAHVLVGGSRLGVWLTLLSVLFNLLGNVIYAPKVEASGFVPIEWVEICTAHGVQTVAVQAETEPDLSKAKGGYCPACPLCPAYQGAAGHFPVVIATLDARSLLPHLRPADDWSVDDRARAPSPFTRLPVVSRAPPASS
jgi:hypothetical protein